MKKKSREKHGDIYDYSLVNYVDSLTKVKIICPIHGEFLQSPRKHLQRQGCPNCVNKTEGKLYNWLFELYPNLVTQYSPKWIGRLKYDFVIEDIKLIIELDGRQHFEYVNHFHRENLLGHTTQQERDIYKMEKANQNGYSIIRLLTEDVRNEKNNWENRLLAAIKSYDTPTNIFICSNNEYEHHKRLLYANTSL